MPADVRIGVRFDQPYHRIRLAAIVAVPFVPDQIDGTAATKRPRLDLDEAVTFELVQRTVRDPVIPVVFVLNFDLAREEYPLKILLKEHL